MNLESKSTIVSPDLTENEVSVKSNSKNISPELLKMLEDGIEAAKAGNRDEAKTLLLNVVEKDKENEDAWFWLASVSEYPEELLGFLSNVLKINPENERALKWQKETKALLAKTLVQRGVDARDKGQEKFAKKCFREAVEQDDENEKAWLWLASFEETEDERLSYLQKVLDINPENETALEAVENIKFEKAATLLSKAKETMEAGKNDEAEKFLDKALENFPKLEEAWLLKAQLSTSSEEKTKYFEKVLDINPKNEVALEALENIKVEQALKLLTKAKEVAAEGKNDEAEQLLNKVLEDVPELEEAWLLKANLANSLQEKTRHFEKVLEISPGNETALEALENIKVEQALKLLSKAKEAAAEGKNDEAERLLDNILEDVPELEEGWLFKAHLATSFGEKIKNFEKVLEINPNNNIANINLMSLRDLVEKDSQNNEENSQNAEKTHEELKEKEVVNNSQEEKSEDVSEDVSEKVETVNAFQENAESGESIQEVSFQEESIDFSDGFLDEDFNLDDWADEVDEKFDLLGIANLRDPEEQNEISSEKNESTFSDEAKNEQDSQNSLNQRVEETPKDENIEFPSIPKPVSDENLRLEKPEEDLESDENIADESFAENDDANSQKITEQVSEDENMETLSSEDEDSSNQENVVETKSPNNTVLCDFCKDTNDVEALVCHSCEAVLTLSDMEVFFASSNENNGLVKQFVESVEAEKVLRDLNAEETKTLGIGYLNIKNYQKGLEYLNESLKMTPEDNLLNTQIDNLTMRLAKIAENHKEDSVESKTIMVVDDNKIIRKLISGKLKKTGHKVISAANGVDAISKLDEETPDLVLLDVAMPRMDGYQVCKLIRNDEKTKDVPVIMISGKDGLFDKAKGKMAGTEYFISKPFGPESLMKTVNECLSESVR